MKPHYYSFERISGYDTCCTVFRSPEHYRQEGTVNIEMDAVLQVARRLFFFSIHVTGCLKTTCFHTQPYLLFSGKFFSLIQIRIPFL